MSEYEVRNAMIESTLLGKEDYGVFTFMLYLDYGGSGQGAGGYCLSNIKVSSASYVGVLVEAILDVVGVAKWEDLPGKHIRVRQSHSKVKAIGHLLEDRWLDFKEFFEAYSDKVKEYDQ